MFRKSYNRPQDAEKNESAEAESESNKSCTKLAFGIRSIRGGKNPSGNQLQIPGE